MPGELFVFRICEIMIWQQHFFTLSQYFDLKLVSSLLLYSGKNTKDADAPESQYDPKSNIGYEVLLWIWIFNVMKTQTQVHLSPQSSHMHIITPPQLKYDAQLDAQQSFCFVLDRFR